MFEAQRNSWKKEKKKSRKMKALLIFLLCCLFQIQCSATTEKEVFSLFDKNHDSFISKREFMNGFQNQKFKRDVLQQQFTLIDSNNDHKISFEEFKKAPSYDF